MLRTKFYTLAVSAAALLGASFFAPSAQAEETLSVHGSTTVYANIFESHQDKLEQETGLKLNIVSNGSSRCVKDLLAGKADMGMISSSMESMSKKIDDPGFAELQGHQVGISKVAFITHPSNTVKDVTLDQVKGVLTGKITNWSELGGEDQAIVIVTEYSGGGIRSTVEKKVTEGPFAGNIKDVPNAPQAVKITSQLPTAFGVATAATVNEGVSVLNTDKKIEQPLVLITKGDPSESAQKLIDAAKALNIN